MTKVLIIGLDGATWGLIKPWADKEELPIWKKAKNIENQEMKQ